MTLLHRKWRAKQQSELYVIGENLYPKDRKYKGTILGTIVLRCMHWKATKKNCKARATIDEESLLVISRFGEHCCDQDPLQRIQISMESKMKNLAATTGDSFRKIFDDVSLENSEVGARINFLRMEAAMRKRREKTNKNLADTMGYETMPKRNDENNQRIKDKESMM